MPIFLQQTKSRDTHLCHAGIRTPVGMCLYNTDHGTLSIFFFTLSHSNLDFLFLFLFVVRRKREKFLPPRIVLLFRVLKVIACRVWLEQDIRCGLDYT